MKLFRVNFVNDDGFDTVLVVAKTKEEAEQKAIDECDYYFYSVKTYEIDQVDGYKILTVKAPSSRKFLKEYSDEYLDKVKQTIECPDVIYNYNEINDIYLKKFDSDYIRLGVRFESGKDKEGEIVTIEIVTVKEAEQEIENYKTCIK